MTTKKVAKPTKKSKAKFDYKTIKTFEDACKKENIDPTKLPDVSMLPEEFQKALVNAYKLYIIYKAINNGWTPDWSKYSEYKYYPWFGVLSSGFGFDDSSYYYDYTTTTVGSRLCSDTSEKAKYIAETFQEEYKEFLLIQK